MRRILSILCLVMLLICMTFTVSAATGASSQQSYATVAADGSCQISISLTLHLEEPVSKLYFPVPAGASGISINGARASTTKSGDVQKISLSKFTKNVVGDVSLNIQYSLRGTVKKNSIGAWELSLPLMSGFDYSVERLSFSVTLPGQISTLPAFSSGYHQTNIEQNLSYQVDGNTVTGTSLKAMKDHETLTMTLVVDKSLFPQIKLSSQSAAFAEKSMLACGLLALAYWLLFLRTFPRRKRYSEMPEGYTAGQLGCILGADGVDLSLTVLTWAQLGYITLQRQKEKVLLHKRMDMGNERTEFEQRTFRKLFGGRNTVDTSGMHYVELCRSLRSKPAGMGELMHRRSGSSKIFRLLCSGMGLFMGIGMGLLLTGGAFLRWLLVIVLAVLGAITAWKFLGKMGTALLRDKKQLLSALIFTGFWLLLGLAANHTAFALLFVLCTWVAGILYAVGGRRTALGHRTRAQVLGLWQFLRGRDKNQLRQLQKNDPDYFFRMAPYAMALGAGKKFARNLGNAKLESCAYLAGGKPMSAAGWNALLEQTVEAMDRRYKNLPMEKTVKFFRNLGR